MVAIRKAYIMESLVAENRDLQRLCNRAQAQVRALSDVTARVGSGELSGHAYRAYSAYLQARKIPSIQAQANAIWALMSANNRNMEALSALQGAVGGVIDTDELQARKRRLDTMALDLLELAGSGAGAVVGLVDSSAGREIATGARKLAESLGDTSREIQQMIEAALRYAATCGQFYSYARFAASYAGGLVEHVSVSPAASFAAAGLTAVRLHSIVLSRFRALQIVGAKVDWSQKFFDDTKVFGDDSVFYVDPATGDDDDEYVLIQADHLANHWVGPLPDEGAQDEGMLPDEGAQGEGMLIDSLLLKPWHITGPGGIGGRWLRDLFEEQGWTWPLLDPDALQALIPPEKRLIEPVLSVVGPDRDIRLVGGTDDADGAQVVAFKLFDAAERDSLQAAARRILETASDAGQGAVVRLGEDGETTTAVGFGRDAIAQLDEGSPVVVLFGSGGDVADSASWAEALVVGYEKAYSTDGAGQPSVSGVTFDLVNPADPASGGNALSVDFVSGAWSACLQGAECSQPDAGIMYARIADVPPLVA